MKRLLQILPVLFLGVIACSAQKLDDLHVQVHGFATQAFVYSTNNNWDTTESSSGSVAWTEAVLNVTARPKPKLRLAVQARYLRLGTLSNRVAVDFASVDFKANEHFGFRAGKVKTPTGLLNESQDIDPAYLWVLLPQSVYPISTRNSLLTLNGVVMYGKVRSTESLGSLNYRLYLGERVLYGNDGFFQTLRDNGATVPDSLSGRAFGATLLWSAPIQGLVLGASAESARDGGKVITPYFPARLEATLRYHPFYFGRYERNKIMFAGEYSRLALKRSLILPGGMVIPGVDDDRSFYVMGSYKVARKLTGGLYYSSAFDEQIEQSSQRFQKDWVFSGRYDFTPFLYLKGEEHLIDGTLRGYSSSNNPNGVAPRTCMTFVKLGVSF